MPLLTQVARARTGPKFAGILGNTHVPSALTCTLRFRTLTMQFWLSCAAPWERAAQRKTMKQTHCLNAWLNRGVCSIFFCLSLSPSNLDEIILTENLFKYPAVNAR